MNFNKHLLFLMLDASHGKIKVENPIVELDGDEMTRIIWHKIKGEVWLLFFSQSLFHLEEFFLSIKDHKKLEEGMII